jgi:hypothetical protein
VDRNPSRRFQLRARPEHGEDPDGRTSRERDPRDRNRAAYNAQRRAAQALERGSTMSALLPQPGGFEG